MAEATANYSALITIEKLSLGAIGGSSEIKLVTGTGAIIPAQVTLDIPTVTALSLNDAQVAGLFAYIALIKGGIDTSAIETEIATILAAS